MAIAKENDLVSSLCIVKNIVSGVFTLSLRKRLRIRSVISVNYHYITV